MQMTVMPYNWECSIQWASGGCM